MSEFRIILSCKFPVSMRGEIRWGIPEPRRLTTKYTIHTKGWQFLFSKYSENGTIHFDCRRKIERMMADRKTIEERLATVERELAELKSRLPANGKKNWIEAITGSFKDDPEFDEVLRLGREIRQADRPTDDDERPAI